jgi:aryl-alcohol dehydrogenase-like predicted oxidoreductase
VREKGYDQTPQQAKSRLWKEQAVMSEQIPERVLLGTSDLRVSPLGVGTNSWGSILQADPGKQSTFEAIVSAKLNFIDTAEVYSLGGSERTLGRFLRQPGSDVVVATKFFPYPWRLSRSSLITALRASLGRLALPQVDLYMLHFPVPPLPLESWIEALADAREAGLTRAVGISNCSPAQMRRAHAVLARRGIPLASNQVEYSLLQRTPEHNGLLQACRELGVTLVAYRPLGYGLLTGKYSAANPPAYLHGRSYNRAYLERITPLLDLLGDIARRRGRTASQVALNWIVCKGGLPIPGAKNPHQVSENAGALGWRLDAEEVGALDRAGEAAAL